MSNNVNWVLTWGQSHSALSLFHYPSCKKTFRLVINSAISSKAVRIKLSNRFGKSDVSVGGVTVALCNEQGTAYSDFKELTFSGEKSFVIRKGESLQSDAIDIDIKVGYHFCISMYIEKGNLTSGNLLNNALLVTAQGDKTHTKLVANERRARDTVIDTASAVLGMPFPKPIPLFDSVELMNADGASAVVAFGDSITQQGFWVNSFEQRLREAFPGKYSLINRSVMGNRLLYDCSPMFIARGLYGKKATERIKEDVYPYEGISHVILFMGINDVFQYASMNAPKKEKPSIEKMSEAVKQIADGVHKMGSKLVCFNIPPFGAAPDATKEKDSLRRQFNDWLNNNQNMFDGFYDIAKVGADPADDYFCRKELIGADGLHPNAEGGKLFANEIDLSWFE